MKGKNEADKGNHSSSPSKEEKDGFLTFFLSERWSKKKKQNVKKLKILPHFEKNLKVTGEAGSTDAVKRTSVNLNIWDRSNRKRRDCKTHLS